jgi:nucleotide-binding universal stress UspA family protein
MYKHLLIAVDGSVLADKALSAGLKLAKALAAKVTVVTVTEQWDPLVMAAMAERGIPNPVADFDERAAEMAAVILAKARAVADQAGVAVETLHVKDRHPSEGIIEAAKQKACDLIVMASHGRRGISRALLGSQANQVVTHSPVPVLIYR